MNMFQTVETPIKHQQARGIPRLKRYLGDEFGRKVVVEIGGFQNMQFLLTVQ